MTLLEIKSRSRSLGRYDEINSAISPGPQLEPEGRRAGGKIAIRHGAVPDPNPLLKGKRQRVAINVHSSALESEYAYGRISEAAYQAGRVYEAIVEAASGQQSGGGSTDGVDRGSVIVRQIMAIVGSIDRAKKSVDLQSDVRSALGRDAEFLLRIVLVDRMTFGQIARLRGRTSGRASRQVGAEFRSALEILAVHWSKTRTPRT